MFYAGYVRYLLELETANISLNKPLLQICWLLADMH